MSGPRTLLAKLPYAKLRYDISSGNITTAAWVALDTSLDAPCVAMMVYYTGESILRLSTGGAGAEDNSELPIYIVPGMSGDQMIPIEMKKGARLSARAVDQNSTSGELVINLFG